VGFQGKRKKILSWLFLMVLTLFLWRSFIIPSGWAENQPREGNKASTSLSVDDIVSRANVVAYYEGKDGKAEVMMTITDRQGRERIRQFTILRMDLKDGGEQKYYAHFSSPTDVRNMVFMIWKHTDRDDDRWLYLPALDLVNRIAAGDKRTSFAGSHFLYEDISGLGLD